MKKIQIIIVLLVVLASTNLVGAEEVINSNEAIAIKKLTGEIFKEHGLEVANTELSFSEKTGSARIFIVLVNNNALYAFSPIRNFNRKGEKDYVGYRNSSSESFKRIHKSFKKNFWGNEKETFMEIRDVHQDIPVWGLYCYQIELLINYFKDVSVGVGIIPCPEVTDEIYSIGLNEFIKKEEWETVKKLAESVEELIVQK